MKQLTVVMYHYVRELPLTRYPGIKGRLYSDFKKQINYLRKHYTFVKLEDIKNAIYEDSSDFPDDAVLLTFDDAYIDHYLNVFPVLAEHDIQGVFFPTAETIIEHRVMSTNKIHFILATEPDTGKLLSDLEMFVQTYKDRFDLEELDFYKKNIVVDSRFDDFNTILFKRLLQRELPEDVREVMLDELFKRYVTSDEKAFAYELYLSTDQIRCMNQYGMEFGGHGFTHRWLNSLPKDQQVSEIDKSIEFLSGIGVDTSDWCMAYPYGAYNEETIEILKNKNCRLAFTTDPGMTILTKDNAYKLARFDTNDIPLE